MASTATFDAAVTNQFIRGFGASSAWNGSGTLAPAAAVLWANDNLDGHVGLSMLRTRIDPTGAFANEAAAMTLAKGQNPNLIIWSTEWTPPAAYKNNNSVNGPGATNTFNNTPANSTAYANYLVNYIKTIKSSYGVDLYAVSPQNEPDWNTSYESCVWTAAQFDDFVRNYLSPAITAAGLTTKIMIPESFSDDLAMAATTMNDAAAAPLVSIIGNHIYGGGPRPLSAGGFSHLTNQESWETEMSDVSGATHDPGMAPALQLAGWIHSCMVTASMNSYHHWWIYSYTGDDSGLYGADTTTPTKKLYVLGNYSKFVRPGFYRMGGTINSNATGVNISAYKNSSGAAGTVVIVAVNTTASPVTESFAVANFSGISVTPWLTDASNNLVHQAGVAVSGGNFSYTLPAQSVVSFVGAAAVVPTATATVTPTRTASRTSTFTASPTATRTPTASATKTATMTPTPSRTPFSSPRPGRLMLAGGCSAWPLGVNFAWQDWGNDFATAGWSTRWPSIQASLDTMAADGVKALRWWVFTDFGSSPLWTGTAAGSTCTGLPAGWLANMTTVADYCQTKGIKLYFTLSSFDMATTSHAFHHEDVVSNATVRQSFIDNAVIPVVANLAGHPAVMAWDIVNEPEWMIQASDGGGANTALTQFPLAQVRAYAQAMAAAIHANAGQPVSVGSASLRWCGMDHDYWSGLGLDFFDVHLYDWMTTGGNAYSPTLQTAASLNLADAGKPIICGESMPQPQNGTNTTVGYTGTGGPLTHQQMAQKLKDNGYAGYLVWAWNDATFDCKPYIAPSFANFAAANPGWTDLQGCASTPTPSPTDTKTGTSTSTGTDTASATPSVSPSRTQTSSPSASASMTALATATQTLTPGPSGTASSSPSASSSASPSPALSATSTATQSASTTVTGSATPTSSATGSGTPSRTMTGTASTTATSTSSASPTPSGSATATTTARSSATSSSSPTPTGSATSTSTATSEAVAPADTPTVTVEAPGAMSEPPAGPLAIEASVPVPNPDPTYIRVKLAGHADRLTLKIWSVGMQLLAEVEGGAASPGWSRIAMPDSVRHGPSGTYYYSVSASQGQRRAKSPPGRFVVLR